MFEIANFISNSETLTSKKWKILYSKASDFERIYSVHFNTILIQIPNNPAT